MKKYKVISIDRSPLNPETNERYLKVGEVVNKFLGNDYGCKQEDEEVHDTECLVVSQQGRKPFLILPLDDVEEITEGV